VFPLELEEPAEELVELTVGRDALRDPTRRAKLVSLVNEALDLVRTDIEVSRMLGCRFDARKAEDAVKAVERACARVLRALPAGFFNVFPGAREDFARAQARAISLGPLMASRRKGTKKRVVASPCAGVRAELRKLVGVEKADTLLQLAREHASKLR
jgi:hypothetical protein